MAKRTCAAVDVHDVMGQPHLVHEGKRNHGEGFVYLPQVDIFFLPAKPCEQFLRGRNRGGGEKTGGLGVAGVAHDICAHGQALIRGRLFGSEHQSRRAVRDRGRVRRSHCAPVTESGFEVRYLFRARICGLFIGADGRAALARGKLHLRNLVIECAGGLRLKSAGQGGQRIVILNGAGELECFGAIFGKGAHQASFVIGVFEPVQEHVVDHLSMAQTGTAAHFGQDVGGICHAFHAARDHDTGLAQRDLVKGDHRGLHTGTAHFIEGRGRDRFAQTGLETRLTCGCLALACRQDAAHQHLVHSFRSGTFHGSLDRMTAKIGRGHIRENALKPTHRRARSTCDYNFLHFWFPPKDMNTES